MDTLTCKITFVIQISIIQKNNYASITNHIFASIVFNGMKIHVIDTMKFDVARPSNLWIHAMQVLKP